MGKAAAARAQVGKVAVVDDRLRMCEVDQLQHASRIKHLPSDDSEADSIASLVGRLGYQPRRCSRRADGTDGTDGPRPCGIRIGGGRTSDRRAQTVLPLRIVYTGSNLHLPDSRP